MKITIISEVLSEPTLLAWGQCAPGVSVLIGTNPLSPSSQPQIEAPKRPMLKVIE